MSEKNDNKVPNVPNLRFDKWNDTWHKCSLKSFTTRVTRKNVGQVSKRPLTISAQYGLIDQSEFFDRQIASKDMSGYYLLKNGEFAYNKSYSNDYPWGAVKRLDKYECGALSTLYICFSLDNSIVSSDFLSHYFETNKWHKGVSDIAGEGARNHGLLNMSVEDYFLTKHYLPSLKEQEKISHFLNLITTRIETQSKIISNLESLIKGIRQRIFSASTFDTHNSKEYELGSFLTEYSKKNIENNLISVSVGKYGIRRRDEIYSKELSEDYSKNKVIEKDSLIIGMGSSQIDIGILSKDEKYCVSPAYTTYKISGINSDYLREYLIHLNSLLSKRYMVIGARQGKSVNKSELMQHVLLVHKIEKQLKIVDIFNAFYDKLQKEKDILSLYKKQKAYLLSNMFI